jgi:CheY-like chemotaxis protein
VEREPVVLVIDDQKLIYEFVRDVATTAGWTSVWASDGALALNKIAQTTPDLMLVDLQMPGVDGREFLVRLQGQNPKHGCPIVVMSGTYSRQVAEEMESLGVMAVLHKPVSIEQLRSILEAVRS